MFIPLVPNVVCRHWLCSLGKGLNCTCHYVGHTARKQMKQNQPPSFSALEANRSALLIRPEVTAKFRRTWPMQPRISDLVHTSQPISTEEASAERLRDSALGWPLPARPSCRKGFGDDGQLVAGPAPAFSAVFIAWQSPGLGRRLPSWDSRHSLSLCLTM